MQEVCSGDGHNVHQHRAQARNYSSNQIDNIVLIQDTHPEDKYYQRVAKVFESPSTYYVLMDYFLL